MQLMKYNATLITFIILGSVDFYIYWCLNLLFIHVKATLFFSPKNFFVYISSKSRKTITFKILRNGMYSYYGLGTLKS